MTDTAGIGQRIAAYRKWVGMKTTQELADAIGNPKISPAVIQNIESGRKAELSVSQLLDIAKGLGISPLLLLLRIGSPESTVDLVNVSDAVAAMTSAEVDVWFTQSEPVASESHEAAQAILLRMRRLVYAVSVYRDLLKEESTDTLSYQMQAHQFRQIAEDVKFLSRQPVDLSFAADVIEQVDLLSATLRAAGIDDDNTFAIAAYRQQMAKRSTTQDEAPTAD